MYFHTAKCLDKSGILMVYNFAVPQIFLGDLFHFVLSQAEIPDIYILLHPLHMNGFRDDGYPTLGIPAEYDLGSALTVFPADLGQFRICENTMFSFCWRWLLYLPVLLLSVKIPCFPSASGPHA